MPRRPTLRERVAANMRPGTLHGSLANAGPVLKAERPRTWAGAAAGTLREVVFTFPGILVASTSPRWYPPEDLTIVQFFVSVHAAGSAGTTTVNLRRNGTTVASVAFGTNTAEDLTITTADITADTDYLQVEVAGFRTGSSDLDAQVRFG